MKNKIKNTILQLLTLIAGCMLFSVIFFNIFFGNILFERNVHNIIFSIVSVVICFIWLVLFGIANKGYYSGEHYEKKKRIESDNK